MNLPALIAEARAVHRYLMTPDSLSIALAARERYDAAKRLDRIIDTLETCSLDESTGTYEAIVALQATAHADSITAAVQACNGGEL